jgi:hypothetical protein
MGSITSGTASAGSLLTQWRSSSWNRYSFKRARACLEPQQQAPREHHRRRARARGQDRTGESAVRSALEHGSAPTGRLPRSGDAAGDHRDLSGANPAVDGASTVRHGHRLPGELQGLWQRAMHGTLADALNVRNAVLDGETIFKMILSLRSPTGDTLMPIDTSLGE